MFGVSVPAFADDLDLALRSIDTIPTQTQLESVENVQQNCARFRPTEKRSLYERSRALSFLMYWPKQHRDLLATQTEPHLKKVALIALAKYFSSELTSFERQSLLTAASSTDPSVVLVVIHATHFLADPIAKEILETAINSPNVGVQKRATKIEASRFVTRK